MKRSDKIVLIGLLACVSLFIYSCARDIKTHSSKFILNTPKDRVLPREAKNRDGTPYTGYMYGTMFNEISFDRVEWEGNFKDGKPVGEFIIYEEIGDGKNVVIFESGEWKSRP